MFQIIDALFSLKHKLQIMVAADAVLFVAAHFAACLLRFDGLLTEEQLHQVLLALPLILAVKLPTFYAFGLYRGMWRFTSLDDMLNIGKAVAVSSLLLTAMLLYATRFEGLSRSVYILDALFTFILTAGLRVSIRCQHDQLVKHLGGTTADGGRKVHAKKLFLLGAGAAAEKIIREIKENPRLPYRAVGLFDDDPAKIGRQIHGIRILGMISDIGTYAEKLAPDELLITIASASGSEMKQVVQHCKDAGLPYKAIPGMASIINGHVSIKAIRDISYEDLLGRSEVRLDQQEIGQYLTGKTVLVTGGGGSIGSELCRQILQFQPRQLIVFDVCEENLYGIQMELVHEHGFGGCVPVLGQIQDAALVDMIMSRHQPDAVFHAAACKHVPLLENNPWEAVFNNIVGTRCLMEAAIRHGVDRFVLVSTDKAVRPTNVMGASKRITELMMQAYSSVQWDGLFHQYPAAGKAENSCRAHATTFMAVRFGNVLGSSGSVIPLFRRQIELGGPVTVTHPDITRYFMSISEAAQLILQAGSMAQGRGGDIFILQMGEPVRIADMARELIRMVGKEPDTEIEVKYIGLREGEKLYEELITEGEGIVPTQHEKIMVLRGERLPDNLHEQIERLRQCALLHDKAAIVSALRQLVPEYAPADH